MAQDTMQGTNTLAAVITAARDHNAARARLSETLTARDEAILAALDNGDSVIDVAYAAQTSQQNIARIASKGAKA